MSYGYLTVDEQTRSSNEIMVVIVSAEIPLAADSRLREVILRCDALSMLRCRNGIAQIKTL